MDGYALEISEAEIARYQVMAKRAQASEALLWAEAGIGPGARVADVGCGPAAALALMALAVGPAGWVSGVDGDESALSRARVLLADAGVENADVRLGRADATGLEADAFDTVVLRHVLAHNGGAEQRIVNHLATLVRPGGFVYLVDVDLSAMRIYPPSPDFADLSAKYIDFHAGRGNDPQVGLRLSELASGAGLEVIHFTGWFDVTVAPVGMRPPAWAARAAMVASGVASDADVTRWAAAFDAFDRAQERPLLFPALFAVVARRPL
ncbi:MAG: methyltransferase domain-containing protein [Propionibacteriaceae bacterium]